GSDGGLGRAKRAKRRPTVHRAKSSRWRRVKNQGWGTLKYVCFDGRTSQSPHTPRPSRGKRHRRVGHRQRKAAGRAQTPRPALQVEEAVGADDEQQGEGGDGDFAEEADDEGAQALLAHFTEVGAQADTGKG